MFRIFGIVPPGRNVKNPAVGEMLDRGGIIGTAEIVDCVETSESPWFVGRFGFVLANVQTVGFIPVKGALGFFDWRRNMADGGLNG